MDKELQAQVDVFVEAHGSPVKAATQLLRTMASEDEKHPNLATLASGLSERCSEDGLNELSKLLKAAAANAKGGDIPLPPRG